MYSLMYHMYVSHISSGIQNSFIQINSMTPQHIINHDVYFNRLPIRQILCYYFCLIQQLL